MNEIANKPRKRIGIGMMEEPVAKSQSQTIKYLIKRDVNKSFSFEHEEVVEESEGSDPKEFKTKWKQDRRCWR